MAESSSKNPSPENSQQLRAIFDRLLPLLDSLADKFRLVFMVGVLLLIWLVVWLFWLKHYSLTTTLIIGGFSALPLLILMRFWWAFEELKDLPDLAGDMLGDAKNEIREKVQGLTQLSGNKLGLFSMGKGLFSVASLARQASDIAGSYLSVITLLNPFMLVMGVLSIGFVAILGIVGIVLVFLAF